MNSDTTDILLRALGSRKRRHILEILREKPGCSVQDVCGNFTSSRIAIMKHLRLLEQAQLIRSEKHGRSRRLFFNAQRIRQLQEHLSLQYGGPGSHHGAEPPPSG